MRSDLLFLLFRRKYEGGRVSGRHQSVDLSLSCTQVLFCVTKVISSCSPHRSLESFKAPSGGTLMYYYTKRWWHLASSRLLVLLLIKCTNELLTQFPISHRKLSETSMITQILRRQVPSGLMWCVRSHLIKL